MKANPGGYIPPSEVVGRADLIADLWRILERQSLVLAAERRIGKTCIIRKMAEESPRDKLCTFRDLEQAHSVVEFVEIVLRDIDSYLSTIGKAAYKARQVLKELRGAEIGGFIKVPAEARTEWKTLLTHAIEDLAENQDRPVVFFWDEVPLMLYNIKTQGGPAGEDLAMDLLDTLRALRQMHGNLRMVFTGSVGLHLVLSRGQDMPIAR